MKPYLVSMEVIGECVDESGIYFAGRWNSKSFDRARKIVAYEKAFEELVTLYSEHEDIFVDDVVSQEKVYRGIEECDDAKCLEKIIKTLKKTIRRN